jgi:hypothetical protein
VASSLLDRVTDHALLRYLERAMSIDLDYIRGQIIEVVDGGEQLGTRHIRGTDGITYVVTPNTREILTLFDERKPRVDMSAAYTKKPKAGRRSVKQLPSVQSSMGKRMKAAAKLRLSRYNEKGQQE